MFQFFLAATGPQAYQKILYEGQKATLIYISNVVTYFLDFLIQGVVCYINNFHSKSTVQ